MLSLAPRRAIHLLAAARRRICAHDTSFRSFSACGQGMEPAGEPVVSEPGTEPISKNELKRRQKAAEKEKEREAKAAAAAAKAAEDPVKPKAAAAVAEEEDPTKYYDTRVASIKSWEAAGVSSYPHKFSVTKSIPAFIEEFDKLETAVVLESVTVSVAGRIYAVRSASSKLQFYDLHGEGSKIQIMANMKYAADESA